MSGLSNLFERNLKGGPLGGEPRRDRSRSIEACLREQECPIEDMAGRSNDLWQGCWAEGSAILNPRRRRKEAHPFQRRTPPLKTDRPSRRRGVTETRPNQ